MPAPQQTKQRVYRETANIPTPRIAKGYYRTDMTGAAGLARALRGIGKLAGKFEKNKKSRDRELKKINLAEGILGMERTQPKVMQGLAGGIFGDRETQDEYDTGLGTAAAMKWQQSLMTSIIEDQAYNLSPEEYQIYFRNKLQKHLASLGTVSDDFRNAFVVASAGLFQKSIGNVGALRRSKMQKELKEGQAALLEIAKINDANKTFVQLFSRMGMPAKKSDISGALQALRDKGFAKVLVGIQSAADWAEAHGFDAEDVADLHKQMVRYKKIGAVITAKSKSKEEKARDDDDDNLIGTFDQPDVKGGAGDDTLLPVIPEPKDNGAPGPEVQAYLASDSHGWTSAQKRTYWTEQQIEEIQANPENFDLSEDALAAMVSTAKLNAEQAAKLTSAVEELRVEQAHYERQREEATEQMAVQAVMSGSKEDLGALKEANPGLYQQIVDRLAHPGGTVETLDNIETPRDALHAFMAGQVSQEDFASTVSHQMASEASEQVLNSPKVAPIMTRIEQTIPREDVRESVRQAVGSDLADLQERGEPLTAQTIYAAAREALANVGETVAASVDTVMQKYAQQPTPEVVTADRDGTDMEEEANPMSGVVAGIGEMLAGAEVPEDLGEAPQLAIPGAESMAISDAYQSAIGGGGAGGRYQKLLDFIGNVEAQGNYNAHFGKAKQNDIDFTSMSLDDVLAWQRQFTQGGSPSSAVGKYQFIRKTLGGLKKQLGLSGSEKFDAALQDRLALQLMKGRGLDAYTSGKISKGTFANNLAKEWASMPVVSGAKAGRSYYSGDGLNKSLTKIDDFLGAIDFG